MSDQLRRVWVVSQVHQWASLTHAGRPAYLDSPAGSVGFMMVFRSEEEAREWAGPGVEIAEGLIPSGAVEVAGGR